MHCQNCGKYYHHCGSCGCDGYSEDGFCSQTCKQIYYNEKTTLLEWFEYTFDKFGLPDETKIEMKEDVIIFTIPKVYPYNER